jgi:hypothetical protein
MILVCFIREFINFPSLLEADEIDSIEFKADFVED